MVGSVFDRLIGEGLIKPPHFLKNNLVYEVIVGSHSYGTNDPDSSDIDICGVAIPTKETVFPHLAGHIDGFGRQKQRFEVFVQHHINYKNQKQYDISVYNIVKYFTLIMENNPNMIDTLFVAQDCIRYINPVGQMIRDNRKLFLHKGSFHKFSGYAHSQLHKMDSQEREGKRKELYDKFGFDVKFAMNLVRLAYECEQILIEGNLDLRRNSEHLKAIRRGDVSRLEILKWWETKEPYLLKLYQESSLRDTPDEPAIKQLLLDCLEHHFGSLEKCITTDGCVNLYKAISNLEESIQLIRSGL